jgi:hypothetical protein
VGWLEEWGVRVGKGNKCSRSLEKQTSRKGEGGGGRQTGR